MSLGCAKSQCEVLRLDTGLMGDFAHAVEFSGIIPRAQNRAGRRRIAATAMIFVPCRNGENAFGRDFVGHDVSLTSPGCNPIQGSRRAAFEPAVLRGHWFRLIVADAIAAGDEDHSRRRDATTAGAILRTQYNP